MNHLMNTTAAVALVSVCALGSSAQAGGFKQPNAAPAATIQAMNAQSAAAKAASQVTIAPLATIQAMNAQAAAGKAASQVTIAPLATIQAMNAQAAAGKAASKVTIAPPATVQSIVAQAAAGKAASQVTLASQAAVAKNAPFVPKGVLTVPGQASSYYSQFGNSGVAGDGSSGFVDTIYKIGVATVGYYGAKAVITAAGWGGLGAAGASTAGTTGVASGTTGAAGAGAAVDTITLTEEAIIILGSPAGL